MENIRKIDRNLLETDEKNEGCWCVPTSMIAKELKMKEKDVISSLEIISYFRPYNLHGKKGQIICSQSCIEYR